MSEKFSKDPDAALEARLDALVRAERAAWPEVPDGLRARVLADAAEVAAGLATERPRETPRREPAERPRRAGSGQRGFLGRLRGVDLWVGAAVTAALVCLAVGLGVGYQAGDAVLAGTGLSGEKVQLARAEEGDAGFLGEDVL